MESTNHNIDTLYVHLCTAVALVSRWIGDFEKTISLGDLPALKLVGDVVRATDQRAVFSQVVQIRTIQKA